MALPHFRWTLGLIFLYSGGAKLLDPQIFDVLIKAYGLVPGAVQFSFPIPDMETWDISKTGGKTKADFVALLGPDKNKTIVIYCGFVKCTRSHNSAAWAKKLGYKNVFKYPDGIFAWKGEKYEVEEVK